MIPNIIHFIYLNREIKKPFLFVHYLSILSAKLVNNPEKIYFYYHAELYGKWWDRIKPFLTLEKIDLPTSIGDKAITKYEHMADVTKLQKLIERGGVYFDIDTISYRPYAELLDNDCVLCWERHHDMICNAIIFGKPNSDFLQLWWTNYHAHFVTDGWSEASVFLPASLYHWTIQNNVQASVKVLDSDYFFQPTHYEWKKILEFPGVDIPQRLITLHLWEKMCMDVVEQIDVKWLYDNKHTLYSKIVLGNPEIVDILDKITNL